METWIWITRDNRGVRNSYLDTTDRYCCDFGHVGFWCFIWDAYMGRLYDDRSLPKSWSVDLNWSWPRFGFLEYPSWLLFCYHFLLLVGKNHWGVSKSLTLGIKNLVPLREMEDSETMCTVMRLTIYLWEIRNLLIVQVRSHLHGCEPKHESELSMKLVYRWRKFENGCT